MGKRKYRQKQRALNQEETRQRIVEATVSLHEELGVRDTSISAIAKEAGVERLTVYRHFPDEHTLLDACVGHYFSQNPLPAPEQWESIEDSETCLRVALSAIYAWYRRTETMMTKAYRDLDSVDALQDRMSPYFEYMNGIRAHLLEKLMPGEHEGTMLDAAIGHALHLHTWISLVSREGLADDRAVELMVKMIISVSRERRPGIMLS